MDQNELNRILKKHEKWFNGMRGERANLSYADLRGVNLEDTNLSGADLSHADLKGAFFRGAHLSFVNFHGANLSQASFLDANLEGAIFAPGWKITRITEQDKKDYEEENGE